MFCLYRSAIRIGLAAAQATGGRATLIISRFSLTQSRRSKILLRRVEPRPVRYKNIVGSSQ